MQTLKKEKHGENTSQPEQMRRILVPPKKAILISEANFDILEIYKDETDHTLSISLNRALDDLRRLKKMQEEKE